MIQCGALVESPETINKGGKRGEEKATEGQIDKGRKGKDRTFAKGAK